MNVLGIRSIGFGIASAMILGASLSAQDFEPLPPAKARGGAVIVNGPDRLEVRGPKGEVRVKGDVRVKRSIRDDGDSEEIVIQKEGDPGDDDADAPKPKGKKKVKRLIVRPDQKVEFYHDGDEPRGKNEDVIIRRGPKEIREFRFEDKPYFRGNAWVGPNPPKFFTFEETPRQHLEAAIRHLREAGMGEEADRLQGELKKMRAKEGPEARGPNPEQMGKIKDDLERVKKELRELRRQMEKLADHDGKSEK